MTANDGSLTLVLEDFANRASGPVAPLPGQRSIPSQRTAMHVQRHCVVVVSDNPAFLERLEQALEPDGFGAAPFSRGQDVLAHVSREGCGCALIDLAMPGLDGLALCGRLDSLRRRTGLWFPLLMVTEQDSSEELTRAMAAGADDFVSKASDGAVLRARVRTLLRRKLERDEHERISGALRDMALDLVRERAAREAAQQRAVLAEELEVVRERTEREAVERRAVIAEELEQANQAIGETQAQLVQAAKMASLGELVAGIAHEINNPLAYVISHLDTVERNLDGIADTIDGHLSEAERPLFEKARKRLGGMRGGLERVRDLVLKLRTFSRLDEDRLRQVDVRESVDSVLAILDHRLGDRIAVTTSYAEDNVIWCFPAPLHQVVMNLLSNAIDAIESDGRIDIRAERDETVFRIVVADNGHGLGADTRARIFEPFFTTKPVGKGTGLGLAISYRNVQAHKGTIEARDNEGGGSEFIVTIPLGLKETSDGE